MLSCPWAWLVVALALAADSSGPPVGRVVLFGDSLAVGLEHPLAKSLGNLRTVARVSANAGEFMAGGRQNQAAREALETQPTLVLFSLGTNDTKPPPGELAQKYPARVAALTSWVRSRVPGARIIWLEPPELPWSRDPIRAAVSAAGAELLLAPKIEQQPDRIHPTAKGYAQWAAAIRKALDE